MRGRQLRQQQNHLVTKSSHMPFSLLLILHVLRDNTKVRTNPFSPPAQTHFLQCSVRVQPRPPRSYCITPFQSLVTSAFATSRATLKGMIPNWMVSVRIVLGLGYALRFYESSTCRKEKVSEGIVVSVWMFQFFQPCKRTILLLLQRTILSSIGLAFQTKHKKSHRSFPFVTKANRTLSKQLILQLRIVR